MSLLEEISYVAKEKYSRGPELLAHAQNIAKHFDLYNKVILKTEVRSFRWNDQSEVWWIETTEKTTSPDSGLSQQRVP